MVKEVTEKLLCDMHKAQGERVLAVQSYRITRKGAARSLDLCRDHAAPLEALIDAVNKRTSMVKTPMKAIEAKKRTARKAAAPTRGAARKR